MDGALRGGFPRTACNQGIVHHRAHGDHGEFSIFPSVCSAFSVAMRTFFAGVAFLLFTLAVCPAPTHADPISDQQLVSLDDGGLACVFKLGDYDKTRDGDIFVVVSGAAGRTVYRPEQNIVEGTQWQGFWGVRLGADVKAGQIDVIMGAPILAAPHLRTGALKAYATTAKTRAPIVPDVPTVDEAGLAGFYIGFWHAIWVPKGTPKDVIAKLNAAAVKALQDPLTRKRLTDNGQELFPPEMLTSDALGKFQKAEIEKWWPVIKAAGIKVQ